MLKQTISYTDYNDQPKTVDLYFNLTKIEATDLFDLLPKMQHFVDITQGAQRDLTMEETKGMLEIIKALIQLSYGKRSDDGELFEKTPEIFNNFKSSAAYDEFVFGLFEDVEVLNNFVAGVMPRGLIEKAEALTNVDLPNGDVEVGGELNATVKEVPAYIREDRNPTQKELSAMSNEELQEAFRRKISQS